MARFQNLLGKPIPECQTVLDLAATGADGGGGGDKLNSKMYKALFKSPPLTYQQSVYLQAIPPTYRPANPVKALKTVKQME